MRFNNFNEWKVRRRRNNVKIEVFFKQSISL